MQALHTWHSKHRKQLPISVFIGFMLLYTSILSEENILIKNFLLQTPTNYFGATSNSVFSILPHFCLNPQIKKPVYQSEYLVCVYHCYLYEKELTFALWDSRISLPQIKQTTKKCLRHRKFVPVLVSFGGPAQLWKTKPSPLRHSEIILLSLIHQ